LIKVASFICWILISKSSNERGDELLVVLDCEVGELLEMWGYQSECTNYACIIGYGCVICYKFAISYKNI